MVYMHSLIWCYSLLQTTPSPFLPTKFVLNFLFQSPKINVHFLNYNSCTFTRFYRYLKSTICILFFLYINGVLNKSKIGKLCAKLIHILKYIKWVFFICVEIAIEEDKFRGMERVTNFENQTYYMPCLMM